MMGKAGSQVTDTELHYRSARRKQSTSVRCLITSVANKLRLHETEASVLPKMIIPATVDHSAKLSLKIRQIRSAVTHFRRLAATPPESSTNAWIPPDRPGRNREVEVGFEPRTFRPGPLTKQNTLFQCQGTSSVSPPAVTDSRIDTQDRGFCPSFPGRFCSYRSVAVVHLKGTSEKRKERVQPPEEGHSTQLLPEMKKFEAGNYSRGGPLDTLNEGNVFHNLVGVLQERSDVGPIEYLEVHASNTGEEYTRVIVEFYYSNKTFE
ncbi:hypothetical protein T265_08651 [Opisthorchis viverrini]|uniref:Uncharacterized protein n=1 Tax=Opisthorchis viverrini TaxID=6198 RepID=A0A075A7N7_OPIVI|nr:hypothetical protein T265_08651 [Opisthorchis viverrini]KER23489.1 hypothetical protein T265_08651 [Opisthorchis viverrini]